MRVSSSRSGVAVLANVAALAVRPDFAITDIGVRGYFSQKNVLGLVMLIADRGRGLPLLRARAGPDAGAPRLPGRRPGGGLAMLALSQSKTSIAITAVLLAAIPLPRAAAPSRARRHGPRRDRRRGASPSPAALLLAGPAARPADAAPRPGPRSDLHRPQRDLGASSPPTSPADPGPASDTAPTGTCRRRRTPSPALRPAAGSARPRSA